MIKIGAEYKDIITGFYGVATGHVKYITGCNQVLIQPKMRDGDFIESRWIDEQRLERVGDKVIKLDNGVTPGFDEVAPKR